MFGTTDCTYCNSFGLVFGINVGVHAIAMIHGG